MPCSLAQHPLVCLRWHVVIHEAHLCAAAAAAVSAAAEDRKDGKLSRKQRKLLSRLKIAELKQLCERPDVVEVWDVTSSDPQLLVFLKVSGHCSIAAAT